ncbi:MAG: energy transducer TonB [Deltaproteobacteria bacterium]|nr:energy transducer TonB [Deltaproteobacteria bacterium]
MFDVTTGNVDKRRKSFGASLVSVLVHGALFGIIFVLAAREVVEKPPEEVEITFFSQKPPPPPPPPPASSSKKKKKKKKKKKIEKKPEIKPEELVQPEEIPEEIPEEEEVEDDEPDEEIDGGVVGGVEGGQKGGVLGGELGGKEGGVVGGDITSLGFGESQGLCQRKPAITYPEQAKAMGVEGKVRLKILIDTNGKVVKRKDEVCKRFQTADKKTRRTRWHPSLCIEAVSGPEPLYYETLVAWGTAKWTPYKSGNVFTRYFANVETNYKLQ